MCPLHAVPQQDVPENCFSVHSCSKGSLGRAGSSDLVCSGEAGEWGMGRGGTQGSAYHSEGTVAQHKTPANSAALMAPCLRSSLCPGCTPRQIPVLRAQMESSLNFLGVPLDGAGISKHEHIVPSPDNAVPLPGPHTSAPRVTLGPSFPLPLTFLQVF